MSPEEERFRFLQLERERALSQKPQPTSSPQVPFALNEGETMGGGSPYPDFNPQYSDLPFPIKIPLNKDALALSGQAAGKGLADTVGMLGDIPMMVVNGVSGLADIPLEAAGLAPTMKLTGPTLSDTISGLAGSAAEDMGYPVQDPSTLTTPDKYNYNMTRFGTGGLTGGLASAGRAAQLENAGKELGFLTNQYAGSNVQKARQVLDDTIAGGGAGYGSTMAQEEFKDSPTAQMVATVAGGIGGSVGSRAAQGLVKKGAEKAIQTGMSVVPQVVKDAAPKLVDKVEFYNTRLPDGTIVKNTDLKESAKYLQDIATDKKAASSSIKDMNKIADQEGVTKLSSGIASDDVGLSGLEDRLRNINKKQFEEKDQMVRTDVSNNIGKMRDPNADVTLPQKLAEEEKARLLAEADSGVVAADKNLRDVQGQKETVQQGIEDTVVPIRAELGNKAKASSTIDEQFNAAKEERGSAVSAEYKAAQEGKTVDLTPIRGSIENINNSVNKLGGFEKAGVPAEFKQSVEDILEKGDAISAEDLGKIRGDISDAADRATRAGNKKLAGNLQQLKADISTTLKDQIPEMKTADVKYAETYAPFFKEGVGGKVAGMKRKATDSAPYKSSDTAKFFLNGSPEAAADLKKIVDIAPDSVQAESAVQRYFAADLAHKLGEKASPRAINKWIANNSAQLDQFPAVKQKFVDLQKNIDSQTVKMSELKGQIDEAAKELKLAEGSAANTRQRVNSGIFKTLVGADPERYVGTLMSGDNRGKKFDETLKLIGNNAEAKAGFKKAVSEHLIKKLSSTNDRLVNKSARDVGHVTHASIAKMMKENEDVLAKVYSPSEMNSLRRMQNILGAYGNLGRNALPGSQTASRQAQDNIMLALESGLRLKFGMLKGGGIMSIARKAAKAVYGDTESEKLVAKAVFDPEVASFLLDMNIKNPVEANRKLIALLGAGAAARENVDEEGTEKNKSDKENNE